ncbi:hypothetical protein PR202_gb29217 [Eleusine coracana subsp. coracana]|uniref:Sulfite oxidase n=1 Tax=Eleusine coracana subsp. coracana TaxID=191504 RepID=A0AAV5G0R7_ELECO|nr:hypothetical protein PR202_gb29217 [Eleusine coracana subsp. coracana]
MALRGPSDYSEEPPRHPSPASTPRSAPSVSQLIIQEPFNAEPTRRDLVASYITPVDFFFKRNHGPIPVLDDVASYYVTIGGLVGQPRRLSLDDIRKLPKYNVTATLQCAGNRRTEMSKSRKVRGVGWDVCALGNATWGGAKLSDVLQLVGVPYHTEITPTGGKHVEFISVDQCPEEKGGPYKASIPLGQATNPAADVLVAYEMNGEVAYHNLHHITKYSSVIMDTLSVPLFLVLLVLDPSNVSNMFSGRHQRRQIRTGYIDLTQQLLLTSGRGIERVDISTDSGKSWFGADRYQKEDVPYVAGDITSDKWAWVLFKAVVDVNVDTEIVAKAVDSSANVQPESVESIWNLRGILNTCWHRVRLLITPSFRSFL